MPIEVYDSSNSFSPAAARAFLGNCQIAVQLRRHGRGLVHVHGLHHYGALCFGLRVSGLKRVVHVHIEESELSLRWALRYPPELIITCARFLINHVRKALPERYQERQQIVAVPNAVDTQIFRPSDKTKAKLRIGAPTEIPMIVMLANLAPHKGQLTAIRVMAELKRLGVDAVCWLTGVERGGEGRYAAQLRSVIAEKGLGSRVKLLGYRDDVPQLLQAADFFILPSTSEGLPLSILEAQASKVLVLASPTAGIPEVVTDGETGFLIHSDDYHGYASRIQSLLNDRDRYSRIADTAQQMVGREYDWKAYYERVWNLYSGI